METKEFIIDDIAYFTRNRFIHSLHGIVHSFFIAVGRWRHLNLFFYLTSENNKMVYHLTQPGHVIRTLKRGGSVILQLAAQNLNSNDEKRCCTMCLWRVWMNGRMDGWLWNVIPKNWRRWRHARQLLWQLQPKLGHIIKASPLTCVTFMAPTPVFVST